MIKLLQCEYRKTRGKYIFLTALVLTAIQIGWALYGKYTDQTLNWGWMMFLYQFPLINAIFMPLLAIVVSSRLADLEHKGNTLKQLAVITDKGRIYDAKFLYGFFIVLLCILLNWIITIMFGYMIGFNGDVPIHLYLLYLLFTITPTMAIYIFQHTLSLLFKNQAVSFFAGIIGTFGGVFAMFLPQLPFLRKILLWGYYGVLQFVGMFGWTKETRMTYVHFDVMGIDGLFFAVLIGVSVMMYIIGRSLFIRKEV